MNTKILFVLPLLFSAFVADADDKAVKINQVQRQQVTQYEPVFGTVVSDRNARVATEISGKITEIKALGSEVKKGEVIAKVDNQFLQIALKKAKAQLKKAQAEQVYLDSRLKAFKALIKDNSISDDEHKSIRSQSEINQYRIDELNQDIDMLNVRLERSHIKAPFDGIVTEQFTQVGEGVAAFDPLLRLLDNHSLSLHVEAPTGLYRQIKAGMQLKIADQGVESLATVTVKYPVENFHSRKFAFRTRVSSDFVIGSSIIVQLPKKQISDAYLIPFDALIKVKQGYQVALLSSDGKVALTKVNKLFHVLDQVAISASSAAQLPESFDIITEGNLKVASGDSVSIIF